jgi:hypothetical protein
VIASTRSRRALVPYDPQLLAQSALFWPLEPAWEVLDDGTGSWPPVSSYRRAFGARPPAVEFTPAKGRPRRRVLRPVERYDASIVNRRVVPTRPRHWHDLFNALVWATFPLAKTALHARQHARICARLARADGRTTLRSREEDALAMIDEGGVLTLAGPGGPRRLLFGHALYEGLVLGAPPQIARELPLSVTPADGPRELLDRTDRALAAALTDEHRLLDPAELPRIALPLGVPDEVWRRPA